MHIRLISSIHSRLLLVLAVVALLTALAGAGAVRYAHATTTATTPACGPSAPSPISGGPWALIAWPGTDVSVAAGLAGDGIPCAKDISADVSAVWGFDAATQTWQAYFPGSSIPGANDLTTLSHGAAYFMALARPSGVTIASDDPFTDFWLFIFEMLYFTLV